MNLEKSNPQQKTLLCVDDDQAIRGLCVSALNNYKVLLAKDGFEALQILEIEDIDIVLSDIMMPKLGGLELLKEIKKQHPDQSVILMTGYSDKDLILEALQTGADNFITKPINVLQLCTTIERILERQKIRKELADLKRTEQLKSDFLGLISHKLKTPTTAISLFIQNIAEGVESPEDANFKQMVEMVQAETIHLEQLIQDLLYFSEATLQENNSELEPVDLGLIAERMIIAMQPAASHRKIHFDSSIKPPLPPKPLMLNPQRISFAIRALLDNAIKFTPEGGSIKIKGEIDTEHVKLAIKDTGVGISQQELAKIFNKFYQIDPEHTGQVRGFGLGLYYARDFIRSMGGQLYIESQPELGTVATIEFPLPR
ncbi:MAG: response regulator [Desulfuromusa sp.]|nr:response regulator [Desulfuromusa sp.]